MLGRWGFQRKLGKGLGTTALFSGEPGTGKSMVAALIAKELGLELYQIDSSRVLSKWIGETEKNLAKVFDAAETGHVVLLFDEADALIGKRTTDVKNANDRYANIETNYILQRLEAFHGVAILTSNLESSIDPALSRRLSFELRFSVPRRRAARRDSGGACSRPSCPLSTTSTSSRWRTASSSPAATSETSCCAPPTSPPATAATRSAWRI